MIILAENYWLLSRAVTGRDTPRKQTLLPGLSQVPRMGPHPPKSALYPIGPGLEKARAIW